MKSTYAIQLQLLGGIWMCQTLPSVLLALCTRFCHPMALLAGWASGLIVGTWMVSELAFKSSTYTLHILGLEIPCYAAVSALVLNLAVSYGLTLVINAVSRPVRRDETSPSDYV
jgi:SSS family solute:Na+ symporter